MIESLSIDIKENKLNKLQLKIIKNENLLKQQENLINAVRLDKNTYNKSLIDKKEEILIH